MFVVQTYLGAVVGEAPSYVYYVQGKTSRQDSFTSEIENRLFEIGRNLGADSHLFAPHPTATDHVASELRDRLGKRYFDIANRTPGFLILRSQLAQYDPSRDEGVFLSLADKDWNFVLDEVERIISEQAVQQSDQAPPERPQSIFEKINKRVQVTFNLGPISIGPR